MPSRAAVAFALAASALLALGCATGAKPEAMAPGGLAEPAEVDAERLAEVPTVTLRTTGGRGTNPLHTSQISNAAFTEALAHAILRAGLFRPVKDDVADYHLHVDLEAFDQPYWGWLDMEVKLGARWKLYAVEEGRLVWERWVESAFTATAEDSSLGIRRLRMAGEGAARANIVDGVTALGRLHPPRPGS